MAKKETNTKKVSTKKAAEKKTASKKVEEKKPKLKEVKVEDELIEVEVATVPESDKDLAVDIMKHVAQDMLAETGNDLEKLKEIPEEEVIEKVKDRIETIKKVNNEKVNTRIDNIFGYLWNGQEMDY